MAPVVPKEPEIVKTQAEFENTPASTEVSVASVVAPQEGIKIDVIVLAKLLESIQTNLSSGTLSVKGVGYDGIEEAISKTDYRIEEIPRFAKL